MADKLNLVPATREIESQIRKMESEFQAKISPYKRSLEELRKINTACEKCAGTGKIFRRSCAEDEGDYYRCEECYGTGEKECFV